MITSTTISPKKRTGFKKAGWSYIQPVFLCPNAKQIEAKMTDVWFVNGRDCAEVSASDRGLAYGDGLFETMRAINGQIPLWQRHKDRLIWGCGQLGIAVDQKKLETEVQKALLAFPDTQAVVKLICTRGGSAEGYKPKVDEINTYIRIAPLNSSIRAYSGLKARLCNHRLAKQPALAGIKHLNRLEQVIASRELPENFDEGVLLDSDGNLIECISSNLILVKGHKLLFPSLQSSGVKGVMQSLLREKSSQAGFEVEEAQIGLGQLGEFEEILATNAVRGIRNIEVIENHWRGSSLSAGDQLRALIKSELSENFFSF